MKRRTILKAGALLPLLAAPRIAAAQGQRVLKFIPQSDLAVLDPIFTTAYVTRNHGYLVFDTLYGQDAQFKAQPQMVEGAVTEADGKLWKLTLRPGLKFHDGTPVLARDCVASLQRWGKRDAFGQALMAATDELSAADDSTIMFRLKKPFPLLPDALGKTGSNVPVIMPERLAKTDAFTQVTEMVGSGPFRFKADERVAGSRVVYERFADYQPRQGAASFTAGGKVANFDRVEWTVIPDSATAAAAMQNGEMDWWENPPGDLLPLLKRSGKLNVTVQDQTGFLGYMRPNFLFPPFDNLAFRRALLGAVNQADFMEAAAGEDTSLWHTPVGAFCPSSPMANTVGMGALSDKPDMAKVRQAVKDSGYKGEKVVVMGAVDFPIINAIVNVGVDMMQKAGVNVDYQAVDWGTVVQRRSKKDPPDKGGWNVFFTYWSGLDNFNPAVDLALRGNGDGGWFGWPVMPKLENLRTQWFDAPDEAAQKRICGEMQQVVFDDVPFYPLGQLYQTTAFKKELSGVLDGFVLFWNVKRGA
ncbi:peptide/nickel transport system substrate-binding protein [Rhizobiales bacterium GAS113]|nr:peptide/nickel transport system substrate-binding protein [Rhizobiales bacterium GAS113]